jgi:KTSC domain
VVEPATAVLSCSIWLAADQDAYGRLRELVLDRSREDLQPLDRRCLQEANVRGWTLDYLVSFLTSEQLYTGRRAQVEARVGRTRYRAPRPPAARARYNLACLFARLALAADGRGGESDRDAFVSLGIRQLEAALSDSSDPRRDRLAAWARTDPGMRGLERFDPEGLAAVLATWGPAERAPIARVPLDSSSLASVGYEADASILEVEFTDGSLYQYVDVPAELFDEIVSSDSPGTTFNETVQGRFAYVRL